MNNTDLRIVELQKLLARYDLASKQLDEANKEIEAVGGLIETILKPLTTYQLNSFAKQHPYFGEWVSTILFERGIGGEEVHDPEYEAYKAKVEKQEAEERMTRRLLDSIDTLDDIGDVADSGNEAIA